MSSVHNSHAEDTHAPVASDVRKIVTIATGLVALNILLMLVLSYTPAAEVGLLLFSNFFVGIGVFVVTVGGGFWLSNVGIENDNLGVAGVGVTLTQVGYGLLGSAILVVAPTALRVPALGITTVVTGGLTAVIGVVVFRSSRSFEKYQWYSRVAFIGGFGLGAVGYFVNSTLILGAGVLFFLGFVLDLTYEIWAVREDRYASDLRNAIGIYVAVMGVFIHVLQLVLRLLELLDN